MDPVADLLTQLRNGYRARLGFVEVPGSKLKASIARVLRDSGFIKGFKLVRDELGMPSLQIQLAYNGATKLPALQGIRRISKPGLRVYISAEKLQALSGNAVSIAVVSTSKGVVSSSTAKTMLVGGELLCEVW